MSDTSDIILEAAIKKNAIRKSRFEQNKSYFLSDFLTPKRSNASQEEIAASWKGIADKYRHEYKCRTLSRKRKGENHDCYK